MARRGRAWSGGAGMERFASVGLVLVSFGRQGEVWLGADWKGKAGKERLGLDWQGSVGQAWRGWVRNGTARRGRRGEARLVLVRAGTVC